MAQSAAARLSPGPGIEMPASTRIGAGNFVGSRFRRACL
jgi:hypothetical protein